jgi:hypothetical protein
MHHRTSVSDALFVFCDSPLPLFLSHTITASFRPLSSLPHFSLPRMLSRYARSDGLQFFTHSFFHCDSRSTNIFELDELFSGLSVKLVMRNHWFFLNCQTNLVVTLLIVSSVSESSLLFSLQARIKMRRDPLVRDVPPSARRGVHCSGEINQVFIHSFSLLSACTLEPSLLFSLRFDSC